MSVARLKKSLKNLLKKFSIVSSHEYNDNDVSGMGLYITSEIAKLHQGWVRMRKDDGRRTFTMFVED